MLNRRETLAGGIAAAAAAALPTPSLAAAWKEAFAAEFRKYVDWRSGPQREILAWIAAEAEGAYEGLDDPLSCDPAEEAREAVYCIGVMA